MKRLLVIVVLVLTAGSMVFAQAAKKGPIVDKIYFDVRMQEDIAMKDTAEGKADVFMWGVQGNVFKALPEDVKAKLEVYNIPSGTWSLMLNPIPNAAPYQVELDGKTYFNALAIRDVRFALNFLINRKYIVDEITGGAGGPMFTMATPGQPGTYKYNLLSSRFGFTAAGNEKKGIADITSALARAAELDENRGRLVKTGGWWTFDGEPITIKFMIRVDDPNGRLKEGRYIADQIEKAGIKVERLEWDRKKCTSLCYNGNPAKFDWQMYTEGWGAGETRQYWDNIVSQMYAPWQGYQAGGGNPDFWNYTNDEIDALTQKVQNGQFKDENDYWTTILKAMEIGLSEATRVYVSYQSQLYVANKARFNRRMAYGLGDGLNQWSQYTADVKPEKDGKKILRITQFSAKGSLFMSAWDPVGLDGFSDMYSLNIANACTEQAAMRTPDGAVDSPLRMSWKDVATKVSFGANDKGEPVVNGEIDVPETAIVFDPILMTWQPVGPGVKSFSKGNYTYKWSKSHSGAQIDVADVMYAQAFTWKWSNKVSDDDRMYDESYASARKSVQDVIKGIVVNPDKTFTVYFDYNHMDKRRIGATSGIDIYLASMSQNVIVTWEIVEALARMVVDGGAEVQNWSFSSDPAFTEVDVLNPKCLADIRAKLQEFIDQEYVPPFIQGYITPAQAVARYKLAIAFIDAHRNAYISNGGFYISDVDLNNNFVELSAFRDPSYPFAAGYWSTLLTSVTTRIDSMTPPAMAARGKALAVALKVSAVDYPANTARGATEKAKVTLTLVTPKGEKVYKAVFVKAGQFTATIPAADTKGLAAGAYTIVAQSQLAAEAPAVESGMLTLF
jgi:peptide/nickel transport system substrate-binding protein